MVKMTRNAIGCLLSTNPEGELPPLGKDILTTFSFSHPRKDRQSKPTSLDFASDYYESLHELCDKGLICFEQTGYRLTDEGRVFLSRLKSRWGEFAV